LLAVRPDIEVEELHGNVDTRLGRLTDGDFDGLILAAAGLHRLGRAEEMSWAFDPSELCPAPGQGALALEARSDNQRAVVVAESITDRGALGTLSAERALVAALDASCNTPLGAFATLESGGRMRLRSFAGLPDGSEWIRDEVTEDASDPDALGTKAAERLLAAGARDILERAERAGAAGTR
jgi:hydroxymethylbilane synthase